MAKIEGSGFTQFNRLLELVETTRTLLDAVVDAGELPDGGAEYLEAMTLPHLEVVQTGFQGSLRSDAAGAAELRYLLLQVAQVRVSPARSPAEERAAAAEALAERRIAEQRGTEGAGRAVRLEGVEAWHFVALTHARVVLASIPKMPEQAVRFPTGRRSYADIPTPRGPAELASRLAELESELWKAVTGRPSRPLDPAFRRTYGFFDAADRLGLGAFRAA